MIFQNLFYTSWEVIQGMWRHPGDSEKSFQVKNHIYNHFWTNDRPKCTWSHMPQNGQNHDFDQKINFR